MHFARILGDGMMLAKSNERTKLLGAIANVVADQVGHNHLGARIVFGNARFALAYQVRAHIGRSGRGGPRKAPNSSYAPRRHLVDPLPTFLLRILRSTARPVEGRERTVITVRRPYAYLAEEFSRAFAGEEDVHVIVDRRYGERRTRWEPVAVEKRRGNRRNPREEIAQIALTT